MTIRNLGSLLQPKRVALIGASSRPGSVGALVARNLSRAGFDGTLRFVNPKGGEIAGISCHASVSALPEAPDLAVVATPPKTIPGLVAELGARGCRAAVVITAGIRGDLRQEMLEAAKPHLLRIQGPNCLGLMLPPLGLDASFSHIAPRSGELAFLSQSGALITGIVDWAASRGIGFSHVVSLGDMADVDFGDMLDYLAGDIRSRAILIYMESLSAAPKFMSAARRAARVKPVIVIKAGRHAAGAQAARSHTGALAGADAAYDAAFRRAGIVRVMELGELFEAAEILAHVDPLSADRLGIVTNGGGAGVLAADRLEDFGLELAALAPATIARLDAALPATWPRANPIDIIGDAGSDRFAAAVEAALDDPGIDALLVINCPTALTSPLDAAKAVIDIIEDRRLSRKAKPVLTTWLGTEAATQARRMFTASRIPTFETPSAAVAGFSQLVRYRRAQDELMATPPSFPEGETDQPDAAARVIQTVLVEGPRMLPEPEAKSLLAAYGIPVVPTEVAVSPDEAAARSRSIFAGGSRAVLKILSREITHKSDIGGVRLGLESPEAVKAAAIAMLARTREASPDARIDGFTVQQMVERPGAHELILGMSEDRTFGPLMMFGAGGVAVEALADTAHALPPLDLKLAHDLIRQTRVWRLLRGYRDRAPADIDAIAQALVRLSRLVARHPEIREIDINPLLADARGVIALDARIRIEDEKARPRIPLAIRPYPSEWVKQIMLAQIPSTILLRPIRPEDERLYHAFFSRVSAADARLRFFAPRPEISHGFLARLTQIDYAREMAFVALDAEGEMLGVARVMADPDLESGEFAVLVRTDFKGRGLGWALMLHLIDWAQATGLKTVIGDILPENTTMIEMARELGFVVAANADDPTTMRATLRTAVP